SCSYVPCGERRQTGCVKISHFPLDGNLLPILIYQKYNFSRRHHSQACQDSFDPVILLFTQQDWCVRH
ncbi:MAG TPA: hypothetical protein VMJ94_01390, partial [Nitrososphaera sp.]|nr:hypothetical protein [Nitrososphaera sp.]